MTSVTTTAQDTPAPTGTRPPLRVLYADDMKQLRELITIVLQREGYVIETALDGQDALDRLTKDPAAFDLLITDHHMPRLNGLELIGQVRQLPYAGKIIIFSSELSQSVNAKYRHYAVDLILPKPIFPLTLRKVLEQMFAPVGAETVPASDTPPPDVTV